MISKLANDITSMPRIFGPVALFLAFCLLTEFLSIKRVKVLWIINIVIGVLYLIIPKIMVYPIIIVILLYAVVGAFKICPKFILYLAIIVICLRIIS